MLSPVSELQVDVKGLQQLAKFFSHIIDYKSSFTATHSSGVATTARTLAELFNYPADVCDLVEIAGYFHDLGKIIIPAEILDKKGRLTEDERAVINTHTYYTNYILRSIPSLKQISKWAAFHHENLDGTGYPFHVDETKIDTIARIMAVADVFTAITEDRPYRLGMTREDTKVILQGMSGHKLDPKIVDVLLKHYDRVNNRRIEMQKKAAEEYRLFSRASLQMD